MADFDVDIVVGSDGGSFGKTEMFDDHFLFEHSGKVRKHPQTETVDDFFSFEHSGKVRKHLHPRS